MKTDHRNLLLHCGVGVAFGLLVGGFFVSSLPPARAANPDPAKRSGVLPATRPGSTRPPSPDRGMTLPGSPAAGLDLAACLDMQLQWDRAIEELRSVLERRDEDPEQAALALVRIGQIQFEAGQLGNAERELRRVRQEFPSQQKAISWADFWLIRIDLQLKKIDLAQAASGITSLLAALQDPCQQLWAELLLAEFESEKHEGGLATARLTKVVQLSDGQCPDVRNWARVQLIKEFVLSWQPGSVAPIFNDIAQDFIQGLASARHMAWAHIWAGQGFLQTKDYPQAVQAFTSAQTLVQGTDPAIACRAALFAGQAWQRANQHALSLQKYREALALSITAGVEEQEDLARLGIGSQLGPADRDQAIATLRLGIKNPAQLSSTDEQLALAVGSLLSSGCTAEDWHKYLLDPFNRPDCTAAIVQAQTGQAPPGPGGPLDKLSERHLWLGLFYEKDKQCANAATEFVEAVNVGNNPHQKCRAGARLVLAYIDLDQPGKAAQAMSSLQVAATNAVKGAPGVAQDALDLAVWTRINTTRCLNTPGVTAPGLAGQLKAAVAQAGGDESTEALADYMLARAWASDGSPGSRLKAAQMEAGVYAVHGNSQNRDVREICACALLCASIDFWRAGDPIKAHQQLDLLAQAWPEGRFNDLIAKYRNTLATKP